MQICARKDKKWELYWWWFKSDSDSNEETEYDTDKCDE